MSSAKVAEADTFSGSPFYRRKIGGRGDFADMTFDTFRSLTFPTSEDLCRDRLEFLCVSHLEVLLEFVDPGGPAAVVFKAWRDVQRHAVDVPVLDEFIHHDMDRPRTICTWPPDWNPGQPFPRRSAKRCKTTG